MGDQLPKKRRQPQPTESMAADLQMAHAAYEARTKLRWIVSAFLLSALTIFVIYRAFTSSAGFVPHLLFMALGTGVIVGLNFLISSNDPDPDPEATKRKRDEAARHRKQLAKAAAERRSVESAEKALLKEKKRQQDLVEKTERDRVYAEQKAIRDQQVAELAASMQLEQIRVQRENRITELMMLAETDPKKAFKLASREGIDIHAEAVKRVAGGAALVGAALGVGAQAGSELVNQIMNNGREKS